MQRSNPGDGTLTAADMQCLPTMRTFQILSSSYLKDTMCCWLPYCATAPEPIPFVTFCPKRDCSHLSSPGPCQPLVPSILCSVFLLPSYTPPGLQSTEPAEQELKPQQPQEEETCTLYAASPGVLSRDGSRVLRGWDESRGGTLSATGWPFGIWRKRS